MADLFSVTAPLLVRFPDNRQDVMVACFRTSQGLVYLRPFWDSLPPAEGVCVINGELTGEGPWKIGAAVITVLGCQGTNPAEAGEFARWKFELEQAGRNYPTRDVMEQAAREAGMLP